MNGATPPGEQICADPNPKAGLGPRLVGRPRPVRCSFDPHLASAQLDATRYVRRPGRGSFPRAELNSVLWAVPGWRHAIWLVAIGCSGQPFAAAFPLLPVVRQKGAAMTRVLIVGDDPAAAESLAFLLGGAGFETSVTAEGLRALVEFDRAGADVLLLDVVLPGMSGIEVLRRLRASSSVPVIMTTARDGELDKVLALELGADDYVMKPYSVPELIARIGAPRRRGAADGPVRGAVLVAGDLRMDVTRHTVTIAGVDAALPLREFLLLESCCGTRAGWSPASDSSNFCGASTARRPIGRWIST